VIRKRLLKPLILSAKEGSAKIKPLSRLLIRRRGRLLISIREPLRRSTLTTIILFTNLIRKRVEGPLTRKVIKSKSKKEYL
jgi:hypothetical protein